MLVLGDHSQYGQFVDIEQEIGFWESTDSRKEDLVRAPTGGLWEDKRSSNLVDRA